MPSLPLPTTTTVPTPAAHPQTALPKQGRTSPGNRAANSEQRAGLVTSAAGIRHGIVEEGHGRGVTSVFGPVRVTRKSYRNRREPNLHPADARLVLPGDPYSLGMRALAAFHLAAGGFGQAQEVIEARTGVTVGRAQLTGLAEDLAAWTDDFYAGRSRDAEEEEQPDSDVIMMQADGKGIAMRPEHRKGGGADPAHPGIKKMAEIVAVADFAPAVREPEDIAAPPARRQAHPGPVARDKWVSASVTESIEDMIAAAYDEADRRDPERVRQRVFLVDGNKQQITAIGARAAGRGLKVPVLIDYIHVSGYIGKAAAALHPGDPAAAGQRADGQLLRVLHGRAKAVAATLAAVAARTRANPRTRHPGLTDVDRAVTYLENNREHMRYDKALEKGWPIATGMIEGACRFVIEDRFGITGARWSPDGAEVILKLRAVVVNGGEGLDGRAGVVLVLGVPDLGQGLLRARVRGLRQRPEHVGDLVEPAALGRSLREHFADRRPEPQRPVAGGQHRGAHAPAGAIAQQVGP